MPDNDVWDVMYSGMPFDLDYLKPGKITVIPKEYTITNCALESPNAHLTDEEREKFLNSHNTQEVIC